MRRGEPVQSAGAKASFSGWFPRHYRPAGKPETGRFDGQLARQIGSYPRAQPENVRLGTLQPERPHDH